MDASWLVGAAVAASWFALVVLFVLLLGSYQQLAIVNERLSALAPPPTRLKNGELFPINLEIPLAPRTFLIMISHGCSGCVDLCKRLTAEREWFDKSGWSLYAMVSGPLSQPNVGADARPLAPGEPIEPMPVPTFATLILDPDRKRFRELQSTIYPTALALVGGRVVEQRQAPRAEWFFDVVNKRGAKGGLLHRRAVNDRSITTRGDTDEVPV